MSACAVCGKGTMEGVSLYRTNEVGIPGVWACKQHYAGPPDPDMFTLVKDLEEVLPIVYPRDKTSIRATGKRS